MGARGPAPTPTKILQMRGSRWPERLGINEPLPEAGAPTCPSWLPTDAKAAWKQLAPVLLDMGVLTKADRLALARYCRLFMRWRRAEDFLDKHGEVYPIRKVVTDRDGNERVEVVGSAPFPQVAIAAKLADQLLRLEQNFGLTPSARSRIQVPGKSKDADDGKSRFFKSGAG